MSDDLTVCRRVGTPCKSRVVVESKAAGGVVGPSQPMADLLHPRVLSDTRGPRPPDGPTLQIRQELFVAVDADESRYTVESVRLQVFEELMNRRAPRVHRARDVPSVGPDFGQRPLAEALEGIAVDIDGVVGHGLR